MMVQPDGSVLEWGSAINPSSGVKEQYEEVWMDVDVVMPAPVLGASPSRSSGSFVLVKGEDKTLDWLGWIIWVGKFCQGIVRKGNDVAVERWEYCDDNKRWFRTWRSGASLTLPCGYVILEDVQMKEGTVLPVPDIGVDGLKWRVEETDFTWQ
jgi:hypothetical protein